MSKSNDFRKLFTGGFSESAEWTDWFINHVYTDDSAMIAYGGGGPAAALLLDRYSLKLGSSEVDLGYISCATTMRPLRGQGYMRRLLTDALLESEARGYAVASLIPASTRLYFFYDKFDFATVLYADEQRYTSLHVFSPDQRFKEVTPTYEDFHALESRLEAVVLHSERDFDNILTDNALDGGYVISVADEEGKPAAMLFASVGSEASVVRYLLATSDEAAETALAMLKERIGELMIIGWAQPTEDPFFLKSRGMLRIVSVERLLAAIAAEHPEMDQVIRVHDRLISANDDVFVVRRGRVDRGASSGRRVTLDVHIDTLAKIIFNSRRIGETFSIPTFRPSMSLMLD